jgi:hypothetical protein
MSTRAERLLDEATQQIDTLSANLASAGEAALARPCPGRGKLGDGTVGAVALHTIDNYRRVARFIEAAPNAAARGPHDAGYRAPDVALGDLLDRLQAAKRALAVLAALDDAALDAVAPAGDMRFADGQRTLEQILASILKHQRHAVDALAAALG